MNILVVRLSAIGDCTLVLPVIRAILEQKPNAKVTWLIGRAAYSLLKDCRHPRLTLMAIDKPRSFKDYRTIKRRLDDHYDVLLAMQASTRANLIYPLVKAERKIGFDKTRARELQWLFTNERIAFRLEHLHDSFCQFAKLLGVTTDNLDWGIETTESLQGIGLPKQYLVINPAASKLERSWFAQHYAEIIDYCQNQFGLTTVLTGGTAQFELQLCEDIKNACRSEVIDLVGKTSLQQLAIVMELAQFCIAPDTGPAHIANAMGTAVIGLYAVAPSRLSGPYFSLTQGQNLTIDKFNDAVKTFLCKNPDEIPWRTRVHNREAMALISVDEVKAKIKDVMISLN